MSAEKRSASNSFGTSQLVKRQKSNVDLPARNSVAINNATGNDGALVEAVCHLVKENPFFWDMG